MNVYVKEGCCLDAPCLKIGDKAPEFTLNAVVKGEQKEVSLSSYKDKWVVLFFYASDFTFV